MRPLLRSSVFGLLAAALLAACGKGTPLTSGTATPGPPYVPHVSSEYKVPTDNARPMGLLAIPPPTDQIFFTENAASKIGVLTASGVVATPEPITPTAKAGPNGIALGPNGLIWFAETNIGKIGQLSASQPPVISEFLLSTKARPTDVTLGSDGNMWVTDPASSAIWKVSQKGVVGGPCLLPAGANPTSIVTGSDGALWVTEEGINRIGRLPVTQTSACGTVSQFGIPTKNAGLATIIAGADGALWFTERAASKLGRMNVTGHVTAEYSLKPAGAPNGLVQGIDNNFYFTDPGSNQIGQLIIAPKQKVTLFKIPTASALPTRLILGPDQQIYFVETAANKLGQFKYFCC